MTDAMPWPIITIDFEASSLDDGTYPIEVGVCRWSAPDRPIEGWSTLIVPIPAWRDHGSWSPASQEVHGIRREELDTGMTPTQAVIALNTIVGTKTASCDGGPYDLNWARMLAGASGVRATFQIGDFDALTGHCDQAGYMPHAAMDGTRAAAPPCSRRRRAADEGARPGHRRRARDIRHHRALTK